MRCLCEYDEKLTPFSFSSFFKDCGKNYLIKGEERFLVCTIGRFTKRGWSFPCMLTDERMITLFSISSLAIGNAQKRGQRTAIGRSADCKAVRLLCVFSIVKIRGFASLFSYIFSKIKANTPCFVAFVYDRKYTSFYLLSIFNFCFSLFENAQKLCNQNSVLVLQTFIYVI